jgi:hypothetical protein
MVMDDWQRRVRKRLPLAEAVLLELRFVMDEAFLAGVFERHRGQGYENELTFGTLVRLVSDALIDHGGSGRQAFERARDRKDLDVSLAATYGKLRRIPQSLSHGLLLETAARLAPVLPPARSTLPRSLRGFTVIAIDGKKIKRVAKRLVAARKFRGSVLGGKTLVALNIETGLAIAMTSDLDGEANDPPLVPELVRQVRTLEFEKPLLHVLDRQFSDLIVPALLAEDREQFVIRHHAKLSFTPAENEKSRRGKDGRGRRYVEEWGWIGRAKDKRRRYVRRITLYRPGEEDVIVFTSLLDAARYPAADVLELYRRRWGIERVFQQITEVFHLRHLIASTPQGTIFQCALCLLLYNVVQALHAHVAQGQRQDRETISLEKMFYDARRELVTWDVVLGSAWSIEHFRHAPSLSDLKPRLAKIAHQVWTPRWRKARKTSTRTQKPKPITPGGHTSIQRLIDKHLRP